MVAVGIDSLIDFVVSCRFIFSESSYMSCFHITLCTNESMFAAIFRGLERKPQVPNCVQSMAWALEPRAQNLDLVFELGKGDKFEKCHTCSKFITSSS